MTVKCIMCARERDVASCVKFDISAKEKAALARMGMTNPPDQMYYCRPCHRTLSDPKRAQNLMRGAWSLHAQGAGLTNADQLAAKFIDRLSKLGSPKPEEGE